MLRLDRSEQIIEYGCLYSDNFFRNGKLNSGSAYGIIRLQKLTLAYRGPMM